MQVHSGNASPPGVMEKVKAEAKRILIDRARVRGMMSYSELADRITATKIGPRDVLLYQVLDAISADEFAEGRGMLSCLVVHKVGDMEPGIGFYDLAVRLGKKPRDKLSFWVNEMHRVHAAWDSSPTLNSADPPVPVANLRTTVVNARSALRSSHRRRAAPTTDRPGRVRPGGTVGTR